MTSPPTAVPAIPPHLGPLPETRAGIVYGLVSAACFGAVCFLAHQASQSLPSQQVLFARTAVSLLWTLPFIWRDVPAALNLRRHPGLWIRACFSSASICLTFYNVKTVGAAPAALMVDCALVVVVLVGWFQGQRLSRLEWICLLLVFSGNVALSWPGQQTVIPPLNLGVGLLAMSLAAVSFLKLNEISQQYRGTDILLVYLLTILPVTLLVPGGVWLMPTGGQLWVLLLLGTLSVVNQLTLTACYKRVNAALGGVLMMTGVLWGGLFDALLMGVKYGPWELGCFGVIFLGMVLLKGLRPTPPPAVLSVCPLPAAGEKTPATAPHTRPEAPHPQSPPVQADGATATWTQPPHTSDPVPRTPAV